MSALRVAANFTNRELRETFYSARQPLSSRVRAMRRYADKAQSHPDTLEEGLTTLFKFLRSPQTPFRGLPLFLDPKSTLETEILELEAWLAMMPLIQGSQNTRTKEKIIQVLYKASTHAPMPTLITTNENWPLRDPRYLKEDTIDPERARRKVYIALLSQCFDPKVFWTCDAALQVFHSRDDCADFFSLRNMVTVKEAPPLPLSDTSLQIMRGLYIPSFIFAAGLILIGALTLNLDALMPGLILLIGHYVIYHDLKEDFPKRIVIIQEKNPKYAQFYSAIGEKLARLPTPSSSK